MSPDFEYFLEWECKAWFHSFFGDISNWFSVGLYMMFVSWNYKKGP
jgi:hypothetical protein